MCKIERIPYLSNSENLSVRKIAERVGLKRSTVGDYLQRASAAGNQLAHPRGLE